MKKHSSKVKYIEWSFPQKNPGFVAVSSKVLMKFHTEVIIAQRWDLSTYSRKTLLYV